MFTRLIYLYLISAYCNLSFADSIQLKSPPIGHDIFWDFASFSVPKYDGFYEKTLEKIDPYERFKTLVLLEYFSFPVCHFPVDVCRETYTRFWQLFRNTERWVDNTPFSKENKNKVRAVVDLYKQSIFFGFDELYDFPIGIPLQGEGKTLITHAKSKASDPFIQADWSHQFGRKVWLVDGEKEPGISEINGEKVYIFDTKSTYKAENGFSSDDLFVYRNLGPMADLFIDRGRCSEIQQRLEYTFLSWNLHSLKQYENEVSDFTRQCFTSPQPTNCRSISSSIHKQHEFAAKLELPKLTECQLEAEYAYGKTFAFFMMKYGRADPTETWRTTLSFDSGAIETKTGALGIELALNYFQDYVFIQPLKMDVPKNTWDEIRKIGVWERIKKTGLKRIEYQQSN